MARRAEPTLVVGLLASLSVLAHAPCARAYCRTTTVSVPADFSPIDGCWNEGNVLWWRNACVGYSLQRSASKQVTLPQASQAIATAFAQWTGTACPQDSAGESRVSIDVRDEGPVDCDMVQYNQDQPNQHVILFHDDDWPYTDAANTLALTTVTYDPDTGEIYDADMEINATVSPIVVDVSPENVPDQGYDFLSIVTHETGHFLGMAHSGDTRATMFAHYATGQTSMRNLTLDDVSGICAIYPPNGTRTTSSGPPVAEDACDPTPRHGFSTECASPQSAGCVKTTIGARLGTGGGVGGVGERTAGERCGGRAVHGALDDAGHDSRVAAGAAALLACALMVRKRRRGAVRPATPLPK